MVDRHFEVIAEPDRRAWRVAHTISWCADHATVARLAKPLTFGSLAGRIETTRRQRRTRTIGLAGLALAALLGGWALRHGAVRTKSLTFTIDGAGAPQNGYVASAMNAQPALSFSDGSRIQLEPRARARVIDLTAHGATVILEGGRANVQVAPRPGSRWQFEAGPCLITVHGTAFSVGWDPLEARFDIHMQSGVVSVTGASSEGDIFLRDTQSLSVTLNDDGAFTANAVESDGGEHDHAFTTASGSDYLVRFPYGTYSHAAEALVRAPWNDAPLQEAQRRAPIRTRRQTQ